MLCANLIAYQNEYRTTPKLHLLFKFLDNRPMQFITEVLDTGAVSVQYDGRVVIRQLTLRLRVYPDQFEVLPHFLEEIIKVPFVMCRYWHTVGYLVNYVEFFYADLICGRNRSSN